MVLAPGLPGAKRFSWAEPDPFLGLDYRNTGGRLDGSARPDPGPRLSGFSLASNRRVFCLNGARTAVLRLEGKLGTSEVRCAGSSLAASLVRLPKP